MLIRKFEASDIDAVLHIERVAWGDGAAGAEQILSRASACPEGSIIAQHLNGEVVGYAAAQRVCSLSCATWAEVTDNGMLTKTHSPKGPIAFGVGMSVLPEAARFGVSGAIIKCYAKTFVADGGCHVMALGSRVPGFSRWHAQHHGTIDAYLGLRRKKLSVDPELCLYQKAGFQVMWPVKNYYPDAQSLNWGAIITMDQETALELAD